MHYYFRTMDELFIAVFRRRAKQGLEAQARALTSPQPLWALWRFMTDPSATRLTMEFMGLANHRKALHAEIALYAQRSREQQTKAMTAVLQQLRGRHRRRARRGVDVLRDRRLQVLVFERSLGMSLGHSEILAFREDQIRATRGRSRCVDALTSPGAH